MRGWICMKIHRLFVTAAAMLSVCGALTFGGCGMDDDELAAAKKRVFTVEQSGICSVSQAKVILQEERMRLEELYGSGVWYLHKDETDMESSLKLTVLNQLQTLEKACIFANHKGITLSDAERAICFRKADAYLEAMGQTQATALGLTRESVGELYAKYYLVDKAFNQLTEHCEDEISDTEALVITVQSVLCASLESAEYVKDCLDQETDIYRMADLYSLANDVEYNVYKGQKGEAYDAVAFSLEKDEISGPVETPEGYYIIKCVSTYNKEETEKRKKVLSQGIKQDYFKELFEKETADYSVKLYQNVWDDVAILRDFTGQSFFVIYENDAIQ